MDFYDELISFHAKRGNAELVLILRHALEEFMEGIDEGREVDNESSETDSDLEEGTYETYIDETGQRYQVYIDDKGFHSLA